MAKLTLQVVPDYVYVPTNEGYKIFRTHSINDLITCNGLVVFIYAGHHFKFHLTPEEVERLIKAVSPPPIQPFESCGVSFAVMVERLNAPQ